MAETISNQEIVEAVESTPTKEDVVPRKTIVYETLVEPTVVRVATEKLKTQLFTKFWLLKPKPEEIQFISIDKYYEPYIVTSGKYLIDYYRKCLYTIKVDDQVQEVILLNNKFVPKRNTNSATKEGNIIKLEGEERIVNEAKSSFILDRYVRDATLEKLPSARPEKNPKKVIAEFGIDEVTQIADVNFVRNRLVKRPYDVERIVTEIFEIGERVIIYTPRFRILYKSTKTKEEKALEFDGVTSERIQQRRSTISKGMQIIKSRFKW